MALQDSNEFNSDISEAAKTPSSLNDTHSSENEENAGNVSCQWQSQAAYSALLC